MFTNKSIDFSYMSICSLARCDSGVQVHTILCWNTVYYCKYLQQ